MFDSYIKEFDSHDPGRFRFFDIMANRLNMRRAVREIVLPEIKALRDEIQELRQEIRALSVIPTKE